MGGACPYLWRLNVTIHIPEPHTLLQFLIHVVWIGNQTCVFCFFCFGKVLSWFWCTSIHKTVGLELGISWCPRIRCFVFFFFLSGQDSWNQRERKKHLTLLCVCCGLVAQLCLTLYNPMDYILWGSSVHGDSSGKNTEVVCHALLQGILPTQGLNPGLWHCRQIEPPEKPNWFLLFLYNYLWRKL